MQERQELVKLVARMWQSYNKQVLLYKSLMSMDISRTLKGLCANGHMSSLVFRQELNNQIYESFKCPFSDGDLWAVTKIGDYRSPDSLCQTVLMQRLFEGQNDLIGFYKIAIQLLWENDESTRLCADHMEKLKDLSQAMNEEYNRIQYFQHQTTEYESVA